MARQVIEVDGFTVVADIPEIPQGFRVSQVEVSACIYDGCGGDAVHGWEVQVVATTVSGWVARFPVNVSHWRREVERHAIASASVLGCVVWDVDESEVTWEPQAAQADECAHYRCA